MSQLLPMFNVPLDSEEVISEKNTNHDNTNLRYLKVTKCPRKKNII